MSRKNTSLRISINDELNDWKASHRFTCRSAAFAKGHKKKWRSDEEKEIQLHMKRWGVNPSKNEYHARFWDRATSIASGSVDGTHSLTLEPLIRGNLSNHDPIEGIEQFLNVELEKILFEGRSCRDSLMERYPWLPFYPPFRSDRNAEVRFVLAKEYQELHQDEIDPLLRFYSIPMDDKESFYLDYQDDKHAHRYNDLTLRAMVAVQATSAKCLGCHTDDVLRWNKSTSETRWRHMFCDECGSTYEIRTKQNLITKMSRGKVEGLGRFDYFHQLKRDLAADKPSAKMFVALIDIDSLVEGGRRSVYWADITDAVTPFMKPHSFTSPSEVKVFSSIMLRETHKWFTIPNYDVNAKQLVREAVDRLFATDKKSNAPENKVARVTFEDLQKEVRELRRTRNRILSLESHGPASDEDRELLQQKDDVLTTLEAKQAEMKALL